MIFLPNRYGALKSGLRILTLAALPLLTASDCGAIFGLGKPKKAAPDPFLSRHRKQAEELRKKSTVHAPVAKGECSACHAEPKKPAALKAEGKELCLSCHKDRRQDLKKKSVHVPFKDMGCDSCHVPHASDQANLLNAPVKDLCSMCHDAGDAGLAAKHMSVKTFAGACTDCHNPHASENPKLIAEFIQHAPFEQRSCEACHQEPSTDGTPKLPDELAETCLMCHSDLLEFKKKKNVHMPFEAGQCTQCHFPHMSRLPGLLRAPAQKMCRECHSDIKDLGHPQHDHRSFKLGAKDPLRKGRPFDCASCHDPHASSHKKFTREKFSTLCRKCHLK